MKIKNVKMIEVRDWDNLVEETYGRTYSFQQQDDCKPRGTHQITIPSEWAEDEDSEMNDSIPEVVNGEEMGVKFQVWLDRDPKTPLQCTAKEAKDSNYYWGKTEEDLKKWQEDKGHISMFYDRNFYPCIEMVANDLHKKGLIEAGDYTINIDW